jgi:hypothetical protein
VSLFLLVSPCPAWPGQGETFVVSLGLSGYRPSLGEVRQKLQGSGGGELVARGDYRGERLYLAAAFAREPRPPGTAPPLRELSYCRYRARSASGDYLIEVEKLTGALARPIKGKPGARLQFYWGGGPSLIRMKREGALEQRGAPPLTQKDWLWGLCGFAGAAYDLSGRLSLNLRYAWDRVPASTFNGAEYELNGQGLIYALALRF